MNIHERIQELVEGSRGIQRAARVRKGINKAVDRGERKQFGSSPTSHEGGEDENVSRSLAQDAREKQRAGVHPQSYVSRGSYSGLKLNRYREDSKTKAQDGKALSAYKLKH